LAGGEMGRSLRKLVLQDRFGYGLVLSHPNRIPPTEVTMNGKMMTIRGTSHPSEMADSSGESLPDEYDDEG
jgi:hypothetical protein